MGKCRICGKNAGWFRKVHKACVENFLADPFVGSKKSKKYHKRSCRYAKGDPSFLEDLSSVSEAMLKKYEPCKVCKPDKP